MVRRERIIRSISPYLQEIYAKGIRIFNEAYMAGDVDGLLKAFRLVYDASITEVKKTIDKLALKAAETIGLDPKRLEGFSAKTVVEEIVEKAREKAFSGYEEFVTRREREARLWHDVSRIIDSLFTRLIIEIDRHGGLVVYRVELVGGGE